MTMKKHLLSLVLVLVLLMNCSTALAATLEQRTTLPASADMTSTDCYVMRSEDGYALYRMDGTRLSDYYGSMYGQNNTNFCQVQNENGLNMQGVIDENGQLIVPMAYGDLGFEKNWVFGVKLEQTTETDADYKSSDARYLISAVDVYFRDRLMLTLTREEYRASNRKVFGQYLVVEINGGGFSIKEDGTRTDYTGDKMYYFHEFENHFNSNYSHDATNQKAFTAECTLTAEEVDQPVMYDDKRGFVDLQGNVLAPQLPNVSTAAFHDTFFTYRINGLYGAADLQGQTVLQPVYGEIASLYGREALFVDGYQAVMKDGKLCYIDENENVTATVDYALNSSDFKGFSNNAPMVYVANMGKVLVITATRGELPEKYDEAKTGKAGQRILAVRSGDQWGVIDMDGNVVIPFEMKYMPEISTDGRYVLGQVDRTYVLYQLSFGDAGQTDAPVVTDVPAENAEETASESSPYERVSKCSSCGYAYQGEKPKFCPECGATLIDAQSEEEMAPQCSGCGLLFEGEVPKFCPDCGTKVEAPAPEPVKCSGCGYMPGEDVPKFCPECGTKFA